MLYKKLQPGDPLKISSRVFNETIDAIEENNKIDVGIGTPVPGVPNGNIVKVKNSSGAALPPYSVLGIDDVVIDPTQNLTEFKRQVFFDGVTPTLASHTGKFVITMDAIPAGQIGRAYAGGVCPVLVNCPTPMALLANAEVNDGDSTQLNNVATGSAEILWIENNNASQQWALVRIGTLAGSLSMTSDDTGNATYPSEIFAVGTIGIVNDNGLFLDINNADSVSPVVGIYAATASQNGAIIVADQQLPNGIKFLDALVIRNPYNVDGYGNGGIAPYPVGGIIDTSGHAHGWGCTLMPDGDAISDPSLNGEDNSLCPDMGLATTWAYDSTFADGILQVTAFFGATSGDQCTTVRFGIQNGASGGANYPGAGDFPPDSTNNDPIGNTFLGGLCIAIANSTTFGVFGATPVAQQTGGAATAGVIYTATEQGMLQKAYNALRAFGFLS